MHRERSRWWNGDCTGITGAQSCHPGASMRCFLGLSCPQEGLDGPTQPCPAPSPLRVKGERARPRHRHTWELPAHRGHSLQWDTGTPQPDLGDCCRIPAPHTRAAPQLRGTAEPREWGLTLGILLNPGNVGLTQGILFNPGNVGLTQGILFNPGNSV